MSSIDTLPLPASRRRSPVRENTLLHGRYRLRERLGAGGFGVVWSARDELLHREVALKRIPLPPAALAPREGGWEGEEDVADRAGREALAAARLAHPAIVALYEAYVEEDAFYLISELVHGETLATLIARRELSDERVAEIGLALAEALAHAHARGVVHRDVKPQNVLVPSSRPGERESPVKLTDFGGARIAGEEALTRTGETLGTLAYMAPEQSEGHQVTEAADVYSLALVLYEALSGENPVRAPTPAATARRIGRPLPPLATRRPDLPPELCAHLDRALAVDPHERPPLAELRDGLRIALEGGLHANSPAREPDPTIRTRPPRRRSVHPSSEQPSLDETPHPEPAPSVVPPLLERLALPRVIWLAAALALAAWEVADARTGLALLALVLAAPLLVLGNRPPLAYLLALLAPLLGLLGLAGAYPALAGQASHWRSRAVLGALGYWWLALSAALITSGSASSRLWLAPPVSPPPRAIWEGSLTAAARHVLAPELTLGLLLGAALWALAAAALPLLVRGRSAPLDALAAVVWCAVLAAATPLALRGLSSQTPLPEPRGLLLGTVLGGALAVGARAMRGPI
ncbi:MAG TPA: serine/threonine-protein kinase [Solirubrobacteraceae bacterium]|nr:serine/threonine-protein kinase [Solirubrobacteraceae bacterium]